MKLKVWNILTNLEIAWFVQNWWWFKVGGCQNGAFCKGWSSQLFLKCFFYRKTLKKIVIYESWYWSKISRATIFTKWTFQVFNWKIEKYWVLCRQTNYFNCNSLKRDRAALVGLPPAALGPQDIAHRITAWPELAGALFMYVNSLENLESCLNLTGL